MAYKRILTVQDISCIGQCSMTVALPILSACGHETCILPTAVLSTHTGGFGKPAVEHLSHLAGATVKHWQENNIDFDAVYVGYLGNAGAIDTVDRIMDEMLAPGGKVIVDPAMADHGKLYSGLDADYAKAMQGLCERADVMIPNITEAAMMTGMPYREHLDEGYISELLAELQGRDVVLTGVSYDPAMTGIVTRVNGKTAFYQHARVGRNYHGTGDMFAACFVGAWMQGKPLEEAVRIAADFTLRSIRNTYEKPAHWYGVKFETALPWLIGELFG